MSTTDSVDAFSLLQNMAPMSYDSSRLIDVACISFSTTDHAHLAALQARHRQTVLAQFAVRPLNHLCSLTPSVTQLVAGCLSVREVDEEGHLSGNHCCYLARLNHQPVHAASLVLPPMNALHPQQQSLSALITAVFSHLLLLSENRQQQCHLELCVEQTYPFCKYELRFT